jgi:hypothetical protein
MRTLYDFAKNAESCTGAREVGDRALLGNLSKREAPSQWPYQSDSA